MEDLLTAVTNLARGRDFKQANEVFSQALCATCHALGRISQGNGFSHDLTVVGSKYTRDTILKSILYMNIHPGEDSLSPPFSFDDSGTSCPHPELQRPCTTRILGSASPLALLCATDESARGLPQSTTFALRSPIKPSTQIIYENEIQTELDHAS